MPGRISLTVLAVLAAAFWAAVLAVHGWSINFSFFSPLSMTVSVLIGGIWLFDKWGWRLPLIRDVVGLPDLRGTWKGSALSNYDGGREIPCFLSIHQTYSTLVVRMISAESRSKSVGATISSADDGQHTIVAYYRNEPNLEVRDKSPIHDGTLALTVDDEGRLSGKYWTDRNTQGVVKFQRIARETSADFTSASNKTGKGGLG